MPKARRRRRICQQLGLIPLPYASLETKCGQARAFSSILPTRLWQRWLCLIWISPTFDGFYRDLLSICVFFHAINCKWHQAVHVSLVVARKRGSLQSIRLSEPVTSHCFRRQRIDTPTHCRIASIRRLPRLRHPSLCWPTWLHFRFHTSRPRAPVL